MYLIDITSNVDANKPMNANYRRLFDTFSHKRLIEKWKSMKKSESIMAWIEI